MLHRNGGFGIGLLCCELLQQGKTDTRLQIFFALRRLTEDFEGRSPARVDPPPFAVRLFDDPGYGAGPAEVEIRIQILAMKLIDLLGVLRTDMAEAQMLRTTAPFFDSTRPLSPLRCAPDLVCSMSSFSNNRATV